MYTELKQWLLEQRELNADLAINYPLKHAGTPFEAFNVVLNHVTELADQYDKDIKGFSASGNALALSLNLKEPEHIKAIQDVVQHLVLAQNQSRMLLEIIGDQEMTPAQHKLVDQMRVKLNH